FKSATGISVTQMFLSSLYGSYLNYRKGSLKIGDGLALGIGGGVGGLASGVLVKLLPNQLLALLFLLLVAFAIGRFYFQLPEGKERELPAPLLFGIGFSVGILAISVGVGGAILITPILVGFFRYPLKKSVSLSLMFVIFSAGAGFLSRLLLGLIDLKMGLPIGVASLVGTYLGVHLYHKIDQKLHKRILLGWYSLVFLLMGYKLLKGEV
ncbi:MAG: sulfite exporter TauE/SafE family protein, partial [Campylobacterales bacterium]